jgi:hypothetical protein
MKTNTRAARAYLRDPRVETSSLPDVDPFTLRMMCVCQGPFSINKDHRYPASGHAVLPYILVTRHAESRPLFHRRVHAGPASRIAWTSSHTPGQDPPPPTKFSPGLIDLHHHDPVTYRCKRGTSRTLPSPEVLPRSPSTNKKTSVDISTHPSTLVLRPANCPTRTAYLALFCVKTIVPRNCERIHVVDRGRPVVLTEQSYEYIRKASQSLGLAN